MPAPGTKTTRRSPSASATVSSCPSGIRSRVAMGGSLRAVGGQILQSSTGRARAPGRQRSARLQDLTPLRSAGAPLVTTVAPTAALRRPADRCRAGDPRDAAALPAQRHRRAGLARRRLPARRAARVDRVGRRTRHRDQPGERRSVELLPHPADRPLHDRRSGELGRARGLLRRRRGGIERRGGRPPPRAGGRTARARGRARRRARPRAAGRARPARCARPRGAADRAGVRAHLVPPRARGGRRRRALGRDPADARGGAGRHAARPARAIRRRSRRSAPRWRRCSQPRSSASG